MIKKLSYCNFHWINTFNKDTCMKLKRGFKFIFWFVRKRYRGPVINKIGKSALLYGSNRDHLVEVSIIGISHSFTERVIVRGPLPWAEPS